jgi:hypothetical protein
MSGVYSIEMPVLLGLGAFMIDVQDRTHVERQGQGATAEGA